jgi:hypothetical protein
LDSDPAIDPAQRNRHADGIDLQFFIRAQTVAQSPDPITLARELFDANLVLIDQKVIFERIDSAIKLELQAANRISR